MVIPGGLTSSIIFQVLARDTASLRPSSRAQRKCGECRQNRSRQPASPDLGLSARLSASGTRLFQSSEFNPMARSRSYAVEAVRSHPVVTSILAGLVASAMLNRFLTNRAEPRNPPTGHFITVDGVRLHYVETRNRTPACPSSRQWKYDTGL
jgi:hypothetical protein